MEQGTLNASLRVLYTINSSPQYILAKSLSQVQAIACNESTASEPAYARASLKACLAAVCDSSPELLQDPARDFSLYVLDPLEAQPMPSSLTHPSNNAGSPRGVAVALGLMSWALESFDSTNVLVTGTIIPSASPALEVVFALRETKRMPKPVVHSYPSFGPMHAPGPSQPHSHQPHPSQAASIGWSSTPYSQQPQQPQRTLTRSADFPELYIGPPRRGRGRPEGSTSSKSKVASQSTGTSSSKVVDMESQSKQEARGKSKQKNKQRSSRVTPTCPPFIRTPLTRNAVTGGSDGGASSKPTSYQQSHTSSAPSYPQAPPSLHPSRNPLSKLLSAVPTTSGDTSENTIHEQQAALLSVLQGLLATNPHLLQLAASNAGLSASGTEPSFETKPTHREAEDEHDDGDSDIVILDSSSVDATAFRKSKQFGVNDGKMSPPFSSQDPAMPSSQGTDSSVPPASTPSSGKGNTPASSRTSTPSTGLQSTPVASPEAKTPTSKQTSLGQTEGGKGAAPRLLAAPATPTPCRTRKRKLDEYARDQASLSVPMSPPSPSPRVMRTTSGSGRALTEKQRIKSSLTSTPISVSSSLARLPSMLGSMRALATSDPLLLANSSGSLTRRWLTSLTTNNTENQTTTVDSGPSTVDHPAITDTTSNNGTLNETSLKRRRTLNEFMAEHEARQSAKVRKRSSSGRRSEVEVTATVSRSALSQSARLASTSRHAQSSPPRPLFRSDSTSNLQPVTSASAPTCIGPSASTSSAAPMKNPLKNFVLPAWARTSTATLPRLSEEALARQQAEREAKKAQVSLKRREAARVKRKRHHDTERLSKESSDEGDSEVVANGSEQRTHYSSSKFAQSAPLLPLPLPTLPVFASDAAEPIPPSPPSHRQTVLPNIPSTPPRKFDCSGSASRRTPSKSSSGSLFTPSHQDPGSLFTPSTTARAMTRAAFTPRSPTVLHRSGARRSPRKGLQQTPWTPKCNNNHQTPKSLRSGRNSQFVSGNLAVRSPQTQMGIGTRAFLLPPPSPCASRALHPQLHSKARGNSSPTNTQSGGIVNHESPTAQQIGERDGGCGREPGDTPLQEDTPVTPERSNDRPSRNEGEERGAIEPYGTNSNGSAAQAEEEYASSPLPPSSPLPNSPFSSPAKHDDNSYGTPTVNSLSVPDSDMLLPSADDSDGLGADTAWLSDAACTTAWFTETEAWLTDTEGGPLMTDSDGTWFSDSDAVFGDMSSLPPSSGSNWLSDDVDADTDGEAVAIENRDGEFDTVVFERAFAALQRGGQNVSQDECGDYSTTHDTRVVDSDLWTSLQQFLVGNGVGAISGNMGNAGDGENVAQQLQELLDGLVDT